MTYRVSKKGLKNVEHEAPGPTLHVVAGPEGGPMPAVHAKTHQITIEIAHDGDEYKDSFLAWTLFPPDSPLGVYLSMTPDQAEQIAHMLTSVAAKTRQIQKDKALPEDIESSLELLE